jgi:hypothetical protein
LRSLSSRKDPDRPSRQDTLWEISISLTRRVEKSKDGVVRTCEIQVHNLIAIVGRRRDLVPKSSDIGRREVSGPLTSCNAKSQYVKKRSGLLYHRNCGSLI